MPGPGTLLSIAMNRDPGPGLFLRCGNCGTIAGQPAAPIRFKHHMTITRRHGGETSPVEWICPACGATGPIGTDEIISNDTTVTCRRTFLCRYRWAVPAILTQVTCPRCGTTQPGPAA